MADRLIFPMGFDLESAQKEAENKMGDMLKRMNDLLRKNPLKVHVATDDSGLSTYTEAFGRSINFMNERLQSLRKEWNRMPNSMKFDANGEFSASAKKIIEKFTQLTEASKRFGMTLDEATRQAIKSLDDEVKAQEKALAATQRRHQQDIDLARKREEVESRVAAKIQQAQAAANDRQNLSVVEQKTNAYNRQAEVVSRLQAKLEQIARIEASGSTRLTLDDGTNSELKNRLIQRSIELTKELGAETVKLSKAETDMFNAQRKDAEQFAKTTQAVVDNLVAAMVKLRDVKGIGVGFEGAKSTTAVNSRLQEFYELSKKLDEIDAKYARLQATGSAESKIGEYTARANALLDERVRITERLVQITKTAEEAQKDRAAKAEAREKEAARIAAEDERRYNEWQAQKEKEVKAAEEAELRKANATKQVIAKQNAELRAEEERRYQEFWAQKEKEVKAAEDAEARKRKAAADAAHAARSAQAKQAQAAYELNKALRAQEDIMGNLTTKLNIYQQQIQGQVVGSDAWNKTALEIRRVTEELQKANQQMMDFQQKAFQGLSGSLTEAKVRALTQYRDQLRQIEQDFNRLNQTGGAYGSDGKLTASANNILKQRQQIIAEINKMLTTAADAQLQREKEINAVIKQRQAEEAKIKAARQAELAALKQKRAENDRIRKILAAEENTIKSITAKLQVQQQRLQSTSLDSKKFERIAAEVERLTKALEEAQKKMNVLSGKTVEPKGVKKTTEQFREQTTYVERLIKRMAVYASFSAIGGFLTKIREVTAQFELQRVSLGAIIQDQTRANQLFSEIKQFALKSPIKILDLTKYVKQVAAYRIETDKLFDTTKRLADVSVGLGVDMRRIVLAYGQVKAASFLRASEVRQFTEAGIPLLELLADRLTQVNGEAVTAAKVMDMISKRMIDFGMVEEVFKDMTSAGGIFYNMQEKQGNTLYGMWAKLGDAASVMYDQIGNTSYVNEGMIATIRLLTDLMRNWQSTARLIGYAGLAVLALVAHKKTLALEIAKVDAIQRTYNARMIQANRLASSSSALTRAQGVAMGAYATTLRAASTAAAAFGTSLTKIGSLIVSTGWGALITGLLYVADKLLLTKSAADKAKESIDGIAAETGIEQTKSVRNFQVLADRAVDTTLGFNKQQEALDELRRTYGKMVPIQDLTIENLERMNHNYRRLTDSVKDYVAAQMRQKMLDEISNTFGADITRWTMDITDALKGAGYAEAEISRFWDRFNELARDKTLETSDVIRQAWIYAVGENNAKVMPAFLKSLNDNTTAAYDKWVYKNIGGFKLFGANFNLQIRDVHNIDLLRDSILEMTAAEEDAETVTKQFSTGVKDFAEIAEAASEKIKNFAAERNKEGQVTYFGAQQTQNFGILTIADELKQSFDKVRSQFDEGAIAFDEGWLKLKASVDRNKPELLSSINFDEILAKIDAELSKPFLNQAYIAALEGLKAFVIELQGNYKKMLPDSATVSQLQARMRQITTAVKTSMDSVKQYIIGNNETVEAYKKRLKEQIGDVKHQVSILSQTIKVMGASLNLLDAEQVAAYKAQKEKLEQEEKTLAALNQMYDTVLTYLPDENKNKGRKEDPRLQNAQEAVNILEKLYSRYKELLKTTSREDALAYINKYYKDNLGYLKKYGVEFDGTVKGQIAGLQKMRSAIVALPKSLKPEKAVAEVDLKIGDTSLNNFTENLKKQLDKISAEVSKSKEAKEFFDDIFAQTSDYDLAMNLTVSVYGEGGGDLQRRMAEQLASVLQGGLDAEGNVWGVEIPAEGIIDPKTFAINYGKLRDVLKNMGDDIPEEQKKMLDDILKNGEKFGADQAKQWAKDLVKAKDFVEQYVDAYQTIAKRQKEIRDKVARGELSAEAGAAMIAGYDDKWAQDQQKLQYEAFKNTPLYTTMFENLENASVGALTAMKNKLQELRSQWGNLNPTQIKELQSRLKEIDDQLAEKDPFKVISEGWRTMGEMAAKYGSRSNLDDMITAKGDEIAKFQAELDAALAQQKGAKEGTEEYAQAADAVNAAAAALKKAQEEQDQLVADANAWSQALGKIKKGVKTVTAIGRKMLDASEAAADFVEAMGGAEDTVELFRDINEVVGKTLDFVDSLIPAIDLMAKTTAEGIKNVERASVILTVITTALQVATALFNLFSNAKVRKAEKEIKKQQDLIDDLEYAYKRLEKQIDSTFGGDYIRNYNERLRSLQRQQSAYLKQADAERSKGKKADEDKIAKYESAARDAADAILDMQREIGARMFGSKLADAARDFAQAWIGAYKEFGNTTTAIKEKFQDMIKNMVVEGVMAQVIERALKPVYDMVDNMKDSDFYNPDFWRDLSATVTAATNNANSAAETTSRFFESVGIMTHDIGSGLTGISRDIATASEESINGLAAGINTQNFYISQIYASVQGIYALMQGRNPQVSAAVGDTSLLGNQHLAQLPMIAQNTANTVSRLEEIAAMLGKVIKPRGANPSVVVHAKI